MAKLPNVDALERPTPRSADGLPRYQAGIAERAEAQSAMAVPQVAAEALQGLSQAALRMQTQQDVYARTKAEDAFLTAAEAEFSRLTTESDIADPATARGYNDFLAQQTNNLITSSGGSPASQAHLESRLGELRGSYVRKMGSAGAEAAQKAVAGQWGRTVQTVVADVYNNPDKLNEAFGSLDARMAEMAPAFSPEYEMALWSAGRQQVIEAGLNAYLDTGNIEGAQDILDSNPGLMGSLSPDSQGRIRRGMAQIQSERTRFQREAASKTAMIETVLGRPLTGTERTQMAYSMGGIDAPKPWAPQSDVGKVMADREKYVSLYGPGSPQVVNFDAMVASKNDNGPKLSDIGSMRSQFTSASDSFVKVRSAYENITASSTDDTGASDLSLIYSYMKMLDPGSMIQQGELATAQNTGGVPGYISNLYNEIMEGTILTPQMRQGFVTQAGNIVSAALGRQLEVEEQYRGIASRSGMRPEDVVIDFVGTLRGEAKPPPDATSEIPEYGADGKRKAR